MLSSLFVLSLLAVSGLAAPARSANTNKAAAAVAPAKNAATAASSSAGSNVSSGKGLQLQAGKRFKVTSGSGKDIVKFDQQRAQSMKAGTAGRAGNRFQEVQVTNAQVSYLANVGVGTPPTQFTLIIDTGSSNTWVGAGNPFKQTSTSKDTGESVAVSYGSGSFSGELFDDTVTISNQLVIQGQPIGAANETTGFDGVDGILGIGPTDLTEGTVSGENEIPTVVDSLFKAKTIQQDLISISFNPTTQENDLNGVLNFGSIDNSQFTGQITFVPITPTSPSNTFWGIDQQVSYGKNNVILKKTAGIVDTGTTLLLLASDALALYQNQTGAVLDNNTGFLSINQQQLDALQSLFFEVGDTTFEFSANAQLWPRALNSLIGGQADQIFLIVGDLGSNSGEGLDFINGMAFLERFFSVYDTGNNQVGLATTPNTFSTIN